MEIQHDTLEKIMEMACLELEPEEKASMQKDLNKMVDWVTKLLEVDTQGVKPLAILSTETNKLRMDEPEDPLSQKEALVNAPEALEPYFSVPAIKE